MWYEGAKMMVPATIFFVNNLFTQKEKLKHKNHKTMYYQISDIYLI